jgi:FkbM family methyltransferase
MNPAIPFRPRWPIRALRFLPGSTNLKFRRYGKLVKAFSGRRRLARTYFGGVMLCDIEDFTAGFIYHFGIWEPHISAFIADRLRPGDAFCDIGANIGYYSLLASHVVGPRGVVIAVEPSPPIFSILRENLALNGARNVRAVEAAVAAQAGRVALYRGPSWNSGMTTTLAEHGFKATDEVDALPLEEILRPDEISRLRLIKIDVEGAEAPILERLLGRIANYPPEMEIIAELAFAENASQSAILQRLVERFAAAGYSAFELPNTYDARSYMHFGGVIAPFPLKLPSIAQKDVLFSRHYSVT